MKLSKFIHRDNALYVTGLTAVILVGVALRVLWAFCVPTEQVYDFATYRTLAINIKNGLGHTLDSVPVAWQGPLYPYVLGMFYRLFGTESELAGKALNIVLSSLTMVLSCPVYDKFFGKRSLTFAAVAVYALLPVNIAYVNVLGTEVLFVFILFALIFLQLYYSRFRLSYPFIGILTGLAALTKPYMTAFPAVLVIIFWLRHKKLKETAFYGIIIMLCMCAALAPWTMRNYRMYGRFIPVSYNGGYVRYINNNSQNQNGWWMNPLSVEDEPETRDVIIRELELAGPVGVKAAPALETVFSESAGRWIAKNPGEFAKLGFLRVYMTFFQGADDMAQWAMNGAEYASERDKNAVESAFGLMLSVLSAAGFIFLLKNIVPFFKGISPRRAARVPDALAFLCVAFFVAVVFVSEGQSRYAFPAYPFLIYSLLTLFPASQICDNQKQEGINEPQKPRP